MLFNFLYHFLDQKFVTYNNECVLMGLETSMKTHCNVYLSIFEVGWSIVLKVPVVISKILSYKNAKFSV